jgi:hypothetical protein
MAPLCALAGVIVGSPPINGHYVPFGSCSRKATASVCFNTRASTGRERTGT